MLRALLNDQNVFVYEHDRDTLKKWAKKGILLCPICGKPYEYCHGKIKSPYFRHKDKNICADKYSEPETEEHMQGKKDLFEWIKRQDGITNTVLEGYISETNQRPDIKFDYDGKPYVIEYQCSPISSEYIERHELYESAGIKDIWICGTQKYFQHYHKGNGIKRLSEVENHSKLYYDAVNKCFHQIVPLKEKEFNKLWDGKGKIHLMRTPYDYRPRTENYYRAKADTNSYWSEYKYPSGRRSNKHPYPEAVYHYCSNHSLTKCYKLDYIRLKGITEWQE